MRPMNRHVDDELREAFQRVYVINMDRRPDRWKQFVEALPEEWPFPPPMRWRATDWRRVAAPSGWTSGEGAWGCYRSHLGILEHSLNQGLESFLIFEDDAVFADGFRRNIERFWRALPGDWSWVYLGGQHIKRFEKLPERINQDVYRPYNVNRSHAYGLRGRAMIQTLYHHLVDWRRWRPKQHVDHRCGDLHGQMEQGLYVPARWLVGQREGKSNIAGDHQPRRFFRGAASLVGAPVTHPVVAVMAASAAEASLAAVLLQQLGIDMGICGKPLSSTDGTARLESEAPGLHRMCGKLVAEPQLKPNQTYAERVSHLRNWAFLRGKEHDSSLGPIGAMNRNLCLLWQELQEAWNQPKTVVVTGSGFDVQPGVALEGSWKRHPQRVAAVERILAHPSSQQYVLAIEAYVADPAGSIAELSRFLDILPTREQQLAARRLGNLAIEHRS